jgi:hypothetical protein
MTRIDIRESLKGSRLLAAIVLVFPIVALAVRAPAAAQAAALENLELSLGATTYRIPRLTLEGGDPSAVAGVFQTGGAAQDARLKGLSAKRIVIPELFTETRAGTLVERARYRDLILTDVAAGHIAVAHATAAEQTLAQADGREARFDWRGLSFRGIDLRQLAHVVAPAATATTAEPARTVLDEEMIDSVSYESLSGDVSLRAGRLTLVGAKARPPGGSAAAPEPGLKALAQAASAFAFERFEVRNLVIEGRVPDATMPFALRIEKIDLRGLANGTLAGGTLDHVALTTPEGGTATLAQFGLRDLVTGSLADGGLPRLAHVHGQDVAVDLPTPQTGPQSRLRFKLAGARLDLESFRERLPSKFTFSLDRLFVDLAARGDAGLAAPLRALGYQSVDLSASAAGGWDEKTGDVILAPVRIAAKDMIDATLSATLGNVSALAFSSSPLIARAAASAASFKALDLTIEGGGLIERLLAQQPPTSTAPATTPHKPGFDATQTLREVIVQNIGDGPNARRVSDAMADYLRASQRLHLRLAGKPSINALDILARKPAEIFEGLQVEATIGAAEPANSAAVP